MYLHTMDRSSDGDTLLCSSKPFRRCPLRYYNLNTNFPSYSHFTIGTAAIADFYDFSLLKLPAYKSITQKKSP